MDLDRLDSLARTLATTGSRRCLLGALTGLSLLGSGVLSPDDAEAKERRRRRKGRHKRRKAAGKQQRQDRRKAQQKRKRKPEPQPTPEPECIPEAASQTCANTCGSVTNNCQQVVECSPCCTMPTVDLLPTDDLQTAIDAACDGVTLTLGPGTWVVPATLQITRPLNLEGAGADQTILDGDNNRRVLEILADVPVTLEALAISNGANAEGGGGISNKGELTLIDAELTANKMTGAGPDSGGGAIFSNNAVTLRNTVMKDNMSAVWGGGILVDAGTLILESDSRIEVNTAAKAGGIFARNNSTVTLKQGSRVFKNHATVDGGGVYASGATLILEDGGSIEENIADAYGGGIIANASAVTLKQGSRIVKNQAEGLGGGIYASLSAKVTLEEGSEVLDNTADEGGAIYNATTDLPPGWVTIESGALICGNSAPACAGKATEGLGVCPTPAGQCP